MRSQNNAATMNRSIRVAPSRRAVVATVATAGDRFSR
jgi:hypothetical protein